MGLDMYLLKKFRVKPEDIKYTGKREDIKEEKIVEITEELIYWRKSNAIHNWFITHSNEPLGNCGQILVSRRGIAKLLGVVSYLLKLLEDDKEGFLFKNQELLPTLIGFFFGITSYGESYIADLEYTKEHLQYVLEENKNTSVFYYSADW
jgi:hypothetical protein